MMSTIYRAHILLEAFHSLPADQGAVNHARREGPSALLNRRYLSRWLNDASLQCWGHRESESSEGRPVAGRAPGSHGTHLWGTGQLEAVRSMSLQTEGGREAFRAQGTRSPSSTAFQKPKRASEPPARACRTTGGWPCPGVQRFPGFSGARPRASSQLLGGYSCSQAHTRRTGSGLLLPFVRALHQQLWRHPEACSKCRTVEPQPLNRIHVSARSVVSKDALSLWGDAGLDPITHQNPLELPLNADSWGQLWD